MRLYTPSLPYSPMTLTGTVSEPDPSNIASFRLFRYDIRGEDLERSIIFPFQELKVVSLNFLWVFLSTLQFLALLLTEPRAIV